MMTEEQAKKIFVYKLLKLCKDHDVAIPCHYPNVPTLIKKGTTLHQLLIEADFMS